MTIEARSLVEIEGIEGKQIESDYQKEVEATATSFMRSAVLIIPEVAGAINEANKINTFKGDFSPSKYTVEKFYDAQNPTYLIRSLKGIMGTKRLEPSVLETWEANFSSIINNGMGEGYADILGSAEPDLLPLYLDSRSVAKASFVGLRNKIQVRMPENEWY